ncbi:MAG: nucleotidyltransferase domain-containing protein [Peptococcaceae bacterium]|nr:nucleotidyltransferase domain-containing protein [Peptococcaceae bacterium]
MVRLSRELYKIDIENQLDDIRSYLGNHPNVAAAFLFGSYGTEFQNCLSDVDVAILLVPGTEIDLDLVGDLYGNLAEIASEEDINVVILNTVPITLQFEVLATGRLLCKKELYLEDFHEYVCKHYADFKIDLDAFNSDYDKALREVYLNGRQQSPTG